MKVICIKQHSQGILVVGRVYEVYNIRTCYCGLGWFDVGLTTKIGVECTRCNKILYTTTWWIDSHKFALLEEKGQMFIEEFIEVEQEY